LFALFAAGFLVKVPVFPFHAWLRDTYMTAPTPVLLGIAGVMGKAGAYAMLRILLPLFPNPNLWWNWNDVIPVLAVIAIAWGAFMALTQRDLKALVAYSSLSHMGFIVLGIFTFNAQGQEGAVIQMVNHGLIVPALFLLIAWLQQRTGTRDRSAIAGLAPRMPIMAGIFMIVALAALGLPGLNSFVGEFMTLLGAWQLAPWLAITGCLGLILAPIYMLRVFQGAMYGPNVSLDPEVAHPDLRRTEIALILPLLALMFVLGLFPNLIGEAIAAVGQPMPW
jgi:NADH-quinone oxidoreductase subunit M